MVYGEKNKEFLQIYPGVPWYSSRGSIWNFTKNLPNFFLGVAKRISRRSSTQDSSWVSLKFLQKVHLDFARSSTGVASRISSEISLKSSTWDFSWSITWNSREIHQTFLQRLPLGLSTLKKLRMYHKRKSENSEKKYSEELIEENSLEKEIKKFLNIFK